MLDGGFHCLILSEERESTATEMSTEEQVSKFLMEELVLSPQKNGAKQSKPSPSPHSAGSCVLLER
jgi:hypothetical protein